MPRGIPRDKTPKEEIKNENTEQLEKEVVAELPEVEKKVEKPVEAVKPEPLPSIDCAGVKCDRAASGSKAEIMLRSLAKQPRVRTRIPKDKSEGANAFASVILNGLRINILKGVSVELPQQVVDVIEESYYKTQKALDDFQVTNPFTGRKTNARIDLQSDADQRALS